MNTPSSLLVAALACGLAVSPATVQSSLLDKLLKKAVDASKMKNSGRSAMTAPSKIPGAMRLNADPTGFDIAGVRLGMTPDQARTAVHAAGYTIAFSPTGQSFEQKVRTKMRERNPAIAYVPSSEQKTPREFSAKGPGGEHLWLRFAQTQAGPRLMFANLSVDEKRIAETKFKDQVLAKYGAPTATYPLAMNYAWCATGIALCGADSTGSKYPYLSYYFGPGGTRLTLTDENRTSRAVEEAVMAEVNRRVPLAGASF